jgi:alpha-glucosidase
MIMESDPEQLEWWKHGPIYQIYYALMDAEWNVLSVQGTIDAYLNAIPDGAWPNWAIGGHDKSRIVTRIGDPPVRLVPMLIFTFTWHSVLLCGLGEPSAGH